MNIRTPIQRRFLVFAAMVSCASLLSAQHVVRIEGDVRVREGETAWLPSFRLPYALMEKDGVVVGHDAIAEIALPDGRYYYALPGTIVSVEKTKKNAVVFTVERGDTIVTQTRYASLTEAFRYAEYGKLYTDVPHFSSGERATLYLLTQKPVKNVETSVPGNWPLCRFNQGVSYKKRALYRARIGFDCATKAQSILVTVSFTLPDDARYTITRGIPYYYSEAHMTAPPRAVPNVNARMTNIRNDRTRQEEERAFLHGEIYTNYHPKNYWKKPFILPAEGRFTSPYGLARKIAGSVSFHRGLDIANTSETLAVAANDGIVRVARELFVRGNCVVIDHGEGLFSTYMHLSTIKVKEGQSVSRGTPIGNLGMTGSATGVHLHWEMRAGNVCVNPRGYLDVTDEFTITTAKEW